jgi:hypothetical protein
MKITSFKKWVGCIFAAATMSAAPNASAVAIMISAGNPGNAGTDNVLFNDSNLLHSGSLVQGNFAGNGSGFIVDFTSNSGNFLLTGSGGQATIEGQSGNDPFTSLTFGLEAGATFTKAILNPDATVDGNIDFSVSYIDAAGSPFVQSWALDGNGQNFFGIVAGDGARITQVTFSSTDSAFNNASQFRLGGFQRGGSVPDGGATVALMGLALGGLSLGRRFLKTPKAC